MGNTPAQVTDAHKALWTKLYNLAHDEIFDVASSDGPATQLIADSEERATQELRLIVDDTRVRFESASRNMNEARRERDQLRAEVERLKESCEATAFVDMALRAERAEAELAKERARLDWLEFRGPWEAWSEPCEDAEITLRGPIRAAIDAAMKEAAT